MFLNFFLSFACFEPHVSYILVSYKTVVQDRKKEVLKDATLVLQINVIVSWYNISARVRRHT